MDTDNSLLMHQGVMTIMQPVLPPTVVIENFIGCSIEHIPCVPWHIMLAQLCAWAERTCISARTAPGHSQWGWLWWPTILTSTCRSYHSILVFCQIQQIYCAYRWGHDILLTMTQPITLSLAHARGAIDYSREAFRTILWKDQGTRGWGQHF